MLGQVIVRDCARQRHPQLAIFAAANLHGAGGTDTVIRDAASGAAGCRSTDRAVLLTRTAEPSLRRDAAGQVALAYFNADGEAAPAALAAAAALHRGPVLLDPASRAVLALAERIARSDIPVLIGGPTGSGKEVFSRFIHHASARAAGPFVAVNCAAMPETMLEAMLFGHRKGAFTGASEAGEGFFRAADGGTLLLDEIAEMPLALQAKLLRALQEGEVTPIGATKPVRVDVRVVACANRDLPLEVVEGRFRADLYYRLNVFPLALPPLRERPGDIAPLAFAMLLRHAAGGDGPAWIEDAALARLREHAWPGNVRELENVVRRALVLAAGERTIAAEHIVFDGAVRMLTQDAGVDDVVPASSNGSVARLSAIARRSEAQAIARTLEECGGNRPETARRLGISERTLRYRLADMRSEQLAAGGAR